MRLLIVFCVAVWLLQIADCKRHRYVRKQKRGNDKKPNIIYILADDLGYNDISYNDPSVLTPVLDDLAANGRILTQYYAAPACSPSRTALLTGYYSFRAGMQHLVMSESNPNFVPLNLTMMQNRLSAAGYSTHMLGKWHLGFCKWECTPTYRGFDTFYGFYGGMGDYLEHTNAGGFDWRDNEKVDSTVTGIHSTDLIEARAIQLIENNDKAKPMFMYLSFPNPHSPFEPSDQYRQMYPDVTDSHRQGYLGLVSQMDAAVGNIVDALKAADMYDNTLIVFTSDNGGETGGGNNMPLRGGKTSLFDGGSRVVGFVHGNKILKKTGREHDGLMHTVDWLPTFLSMAGSPVDPTEPMDGVDQTEMIIDGKDSARNELIYNIDDDIMPLFGKAAIRVGDFKLIDGFPGMVDGYGDIYSVYKDPDAPSSHSYGVTPEEAVRLRQLMEEAKGKFQLYNLADDPTETTDLADSMPDKVAELRERLAVHRGNYVAPPPGSADTDPNSDPTKYGGSWTPGWC